MDAKHRAATAFRVARAARIEPGRYPIVEIKPGTIIAPPHGVVWAVLGPLGGGGHGDVWSAFDLGQCFEVHLPEARMNLPAVPPEGAIWQCDPRILQLLAEQEQRVALKVLRLDQLPAAHHAEMIARLMLEGDICSTAKEPQIPRCFAARRKPLPFIVMELIEGETLEDYLERIRRERRYVPWYIISKILGDLLDALEVLHARGIVHRDLKPANCMMADSRGWRGQILKLIDFGIAKILSERRLVETVGSQATGRVLGGRRAQLAGVESRVGGLHMLTALFAAPEQHAPPGSQPISFATDFFAVGCMLYEMVMGRPRLPETLDLEAIRQAMVQPLPRITHPDLGPRTCTSLQEFLAWLLAYQPQDRPQTVRQVHNGTEERPGLTAVRQQHRAEGGPPPVPPDA